MPLTSDQVCSWAPPFVPVASSCRTRMRSPAPRGGRSGISRQGSVGAGAVMSGPPFDQQAVDRLVQRAPLVLVGLVAAQEVEAAAAGGQPIAEVGRGAGDARREVTRLGVHTGVVEEALDAVVEADGGEDDPTPDLEPPELQAAPFALGSLELGESMHEAPAAGSALRGREEPFGVPTGLVELDEGVDRLRGRLDDMELVRPGGLGAPDLAPDLVARLLVERVEVGLPIALRRERQDRADVLQLAGDRPTLAGGAGIERGLELLATGTN